MSWSMLLANSSPSLSLILDSLHWKAFRVQDHTLWQQQTISSPRFFQIWINPCFEQSIQNQVPCLSDSSSADSVVNLIWLCKAFERRPDIIPGPGPMWSCWSIQTFYLTIWIAIVVSFQTIIWSFLVYLVVCSATEIHSSFRCHVMSLIACVQQETS